MQQIGDGTNDARGAKGCSHEVIKLDKAFQMVNVETFVTFHEIRLVHDGILISPFMKFMT